MPLIDGSMLRKGESNKAIPILDAWISKQAPKHIQEFAEWQSIVSAFQGHSKAEAVINHLRQKQLKLTVRHGDFARWNLLKTHEGNIMVLDWEWSTPCGMPGIDLVHLFAQDARLVDRLSANAIVQSTIHALEAQDCQAYLKKTGWGRDIKSAMVASIAFTVGTKQQANEEVLLNLLNDW
jgi:thiamine kinase-like enzyme